MKNPEKKTRDNADPEDASKELKKIIEQREREELLFTTEELIPQPDLNREIEKIELRSGVIINLKEINDVIYGKARKMPAMFPNEKPFFKLMYKLRGWTWLNPDAFEKPACAGKDIKQYIYARFAPEVLPSLMSFENPILHGYVKKYKLYQFLNDQGLLMLEGFIRDAMDVMAESKNWYEFELRYATKYKLNVQLNLFPND